MSRAVYLFDSNAKLLKKGSLTYDEDTLKYTFSATEAYITQGSIEVDELCIVVPDTMFTKANTGIFGSFVSPVRNPLGLVPGEWEARTIIDGATETTYLNCAIFALDLAFYTYVAGRYGFAIGFVDSTTGAIDKTPYDSYTVQNGVDNFTENNLTASDYDNLLTAITNLTSTIGGNVSQLLSDVATLKATAITLETDKHEFSAIVGVWNETTSKDTPIYSKLKVDEIDTAIVLNINAHKARTNNPHSVTKAQVGLGNADDTADDDKPVSTAQLAALDTKANLTGGNSFTGNQAINGTINAEGIVVVNASITSQLNKNNTKIVNLANGVNNNDAVNKGQLDLKVNKAQSIIGIKLQDDITLSEFKTALGNATQSVAGLLSAEDKTHLDGLVALLESSDGNTVVDTIGEILAIFQNYPEGADLVTVLNGKVDKEAGKGLSQNDFTDVDKNKVNLSYTHSEIVDGSNPHNTKFVNIADKPTTRDGYGITDVYTKPETYTQLEINNLLDNLSAVKGLKSTLLTPTELSNGDTISTNLLTNNGAFVVFTATDTSTEEIDSDTVPVSTIITGKKFVFFDNQEIVFTIGETNSTFETSEDITLKINLLYLDSENVQAVGVEFDGSLTNYLENQENVQSAINKLDEELKTTNDNKVDKVTGKGLSTEDYTTTEKNKLSGIEAGAEVNVQSDWTQEVNTADDYIKNKPAIPTKTSDLTNDTGYITGYTETDPIFTAWDKSTGISITKSQITDLIEATQSLSGLMSATDKQRLDVLHALLEENEANTVVDSINEILAIFNNYPEGADLVSALALKADKTALDSKVDKNNAITAGTKTKITYDSKGLVTGGVDLVASDIPELPQSKVTSLVTDLGNKVNKNADIVGATKAKITYDSKGLVTSGDDLEESDIPTLSASKITQTSTARFVTDTEKSTWNGKQNALTAGNGISISGNVISADGGLTVDSWITATKTLALSDANKLIVCADTANQTLIIPTHDSVPFPIGTITTFLLLNPYKVTFTAETGVILTSIAGLVELATQYGMASLIKIAADTWQLVGALE